MSQQNAWTGFLGQLKEAKDAETFLDSIFGTDCYSQALRDVGSGCKGLGQADKSRLAFVLAGCHMRQLGHRQGKCKATMSLKECAELLDDRGYSTYLKFLAELDRFLLFSLSAAHLQACKCIVQDYILTSVGSASCKSQQDQE